MRSVLLATLILFFLVLQSQLWTGEGGLLNAYRLRQTIHSESVENDQLRLRNHKLDVQVQALKHEPEALEEHARLELGMIKDGEDFYLVVGQESDR